MTYNELMENIRKNSISLSCFSINQDLKPNAYILINNYDKWEYFYLDEKGNRFDSTVFSDPEKAFDFFWNKLLVENRYPPSIPPKSVGL
jgi:hypothetical protein